MFASNPPLLSLADPQLAQVVTLMHQRPQSAWTLETLAEAGNMSRTRFANKFRDVVGKTPMDYLTAWRISVAQQQLRSGKPIKAVAAGVGYDSVAAFARVFAKIVGQPPRRWLMDSKP